MPRSLNLRVILLLLCVATYGVTPLLGIVLPRAASAEDAAHGAKEKGKDEGQAKRTRKRQLKKPGEGTAKEVKDEPFAVAGGAKKFGKAEFDEELKSGDALDAVLVIDASRSMKRTDPNRLRDQGAKLFLRFLSPGDRLAIIQFDQDTKILTTFKDVTPESVREFDKTIEEIPAEGNFTDLWSPLVAALQLHTEEGRKDAKKAVVLLSDGKMDPSPAVGTADDLSDRLAKTDLPAYRDTHVILYTLGMSPEADRDYLANIAKATDGLYWYAPDVNLVHQSFSDLFLAMKKPQVLELTGSGFEIDGTTNEATFYLNRTDVEQQVTITDPQGKSFGNTTIPSGVKWYRGSLFDVITVVNPMPGKWAVSGIENPEGFATLLTDLKLQVRWPDVNVQKGDTVVFMARLTEKGETVATPGMKEITFYTYKVLGSDGHLLRNGTLNDKGEDGDAAAGDNIYSSKMKLDDEGEFKALIAVTGPTFSRQQHVSFTVSGGMISMVHTQPDEFAGQPEGFLISLSPAAQHLKKVKAQFMEKPKGEEKIKALALEAFEKSPGVYFVPASKLQKGTYELHARVSGFSEKNEPVKAASETIEYSVKSEAHKKPHSSSETEVEEVEEHHEEQPANEGEIEETGEEDPSEPAHGNSDLLFGICAVLLSLAWVGGTSFVMYRKAGSQGSITVSERTPYVVPEEIEAQLKSLRERASDTRREPTEEERKLFSLVWGGVPDELGVSRGAVDAGSEGANPTEDEESGEAAH